MPDLLDSVILGTEPQAASDLLDSVDLGTDVYGENHLQLPPRQTRSGRAYCSILKVTEYGCPKLDIARPDAVAHPDTVSETVIENRGRDILGLTCPTSLATIGNSLSGLQQNLIKSFLNFFIISFRSKLERFYQIFEK